MIAKACLDNPQCKAFNSLGYLRYEHDPKSKWTNIPGKCAGPNKTPHNARRKKHERSNSFFSSLSEATNANFDSSTIIASAGPIIAKGVVVLIALNGLGQMIVPQRILKMNEAPTGPFNSHLVTCTGNSAEPYSIVVGSLQWGLADHWVEAVGYSMTPLVIGALTNLAVGNVKRVGYQFKSDVMPLVNGVIVAFVCLMDYDGYGDFTAKSFRIHNGCKWHHFGCGTLDALQLMRLKVLRNHRERTNLPGLLEGTRTFPAHAWNLDDVCDK